MHNIYKLKAVLCTHTHTRAHWPGTRCVPIPPPTLQGVLFPQGNNKKTTTCVMSCSRSRCCELRTHSRPRQRRRRFSISPGKRRHKTGTRGTSENKALCPIFSSVVTPPPGRKHAGPNSLGLFCLFKHKFHPSPLWPCATFLPQRAILTEQAHPLGSE